MSWQRLPICLRLINRRQYCNSESIKKLNFANKALFGAVQKKTIKNSLPTEVDPPAPTPNQKYDVSSEMYWMLSHHQQSVITAPSKSFRKIKRKVSSSSQTAASLQQSSIQTSLSLLKNLPRNVSPALQPIKLTQRKLQQSYDKSSIPPSLTNFNASLCPVPIKLRPAAALSLPDTGGIPPLNIDRLVDVLDVPAFGDELRKFPIVELDMKRIPSVGKILQATMPEPVRKALLKWKLLKIAELGEDGFREMQQCMFDFFFNILLFLNFLCVQLI